MAVLIVNVSEQYGVEYGKGLQHYELRINHQFKAKFTHDFEDGLAKCLRKAADAFEGVEALHLFHQTHVILDKHKEIK